MEKDFEKEHESDLKKKAAAAAAIAAVITSSGAVIDHVIDDPAQILQANTAEPAVLNIDAVADAIADDEDKVAAHKLTLSERILALPLAVRICVVLPLWAVGHLVNMGLGALAVAASPLVNLLISFGILFLVLGTTFTLAAKAMFPDLPLRKIVNRHTLKGIFVGSGLIFAGDLILPAVWPEYTAYKGLVMGGSILAVLALLAAKFARHENKRRAKEAQEAALSEAPAQLVVKSLGDTFTMRDPLA